MGLYPLAVVRANVDIDRNDPAFAYELQQAGRQDGGAAMGDACFYDDVGFSA